MKKKLLSLALTLALCLGLTVPAFAANQKGETTVTDKSGNTYTLSNPILYTISKEQIEQIPLAADYFTDELMTGRDFPLKGATQAYAVPTGTTITAPGNMNFEGFIWVDTRKEGNAYCVADSGMGTPIWTSIDLDDEDGNTFWVLPCYSGGIDSENRTYVSDIVFFTPSEENTKVNPFGGSTQISDWAKDQVSKATASGLVADGLGNNYQVNITRAQFAATTVKLYEAMSGQTAPAAGNSPFTDTSDPAVIQAQTLGFVSGVGDGKFAPNALVTREQAASMLSRVYTKLGGNIPTVTATTFADNGSVSAWARDAVAFMSDKGIVSGVGNNNFAPQGNASIEQALSIALRMFENLK